MNRLRFLLLVLALGAGAASGQATPDETAFWESVRESRNPVELQAYLDRYPNGSFAVLARARLVVLGAPVATPASVGPPQSGDSWTYRLSYPRLRGEWGRPRRPAQIVVATIASVSGSEILDQLAVDGVAQPSMKHGKGGYLIEQTVSVFSPYLAAFVGDLSTQPRLGDVEILEAGCGIKYFCQARARMAGSETVAVPAGKFAAIKVTIEETWRPGSGSVVGLQTAQLNGGRLLTVWYVPELKRAVKYASRRTVGDAPPIEPTFDLELISYKLK